MNLAGWFDLYLSKDASREIRNFVLPSPDFEGQHGDIFVERLRIDKTGDHGRPRYLLFISDLSEEIRSGFVRELSNALREDFDRLMRARQQEEVRDVIDRVRHICKKMESTYKSSSEVLNGYEKDRPVPEVQDHDVIAKKPPRSTFRWIRSAVILALCVIAGSYVISYFAFVKTIEELREVREILPTLTGAIDKQVTSIYTEMTDIHAEMESLDSSLKEIKETTKDLEDITLREMKKLLKSISARIEKLENKNSVDNNERNNESQDALQNPSDAE